MMEHFLKFLGSLFLVLCLFKLETSTTATESNSTSAHRQQKLLSLFQIVTFKCGYPMYQKEFNREIRPKNEACNTGGTRNGTCYTNAECETRGGKSTGSCANGFGVCCIFTLDCGQSTAENCTYLVRSSTTATLNPCTYTVCPGSDDICRLRFDFTTFNINGPVTGQTETDPSLEASTTIGGSLGDCTTDAFTVTSPGNFAPPLICGFNSGQHMIVDASPGRCNEANFRLSGSGTREWDIKVTQYRCGDEQGGPEGCLQYFTGVTGTVASFNFPTSAMALDTTTTHLSSQTQTMCWRQEANTCAICWIPEILGSSMIQGSFGLSNPVGRQVLGQTDGKCQGDYILIPNAESNVETDAANTFIIGSIGSDVQLSDRLCGRFLSSANNKLDREASISVCTQQRPFRMTFKSDADEFTLSQFPTPKKLNFASFNELNRIPAGIVGFNLRWTLQNCS